VWLAGEPLDLCVTSFFLILSLDIVLGLNGNEVLICELAVGFGVGLCDRAVVARFVIVPACPKVVRLYRTYLRNRTVVVCSISLVGDSNTFDITEDGRSFTRPLRLTFGGF
jgi:hypothetical protein